MAKARKSKTEDGVVAVLDEPLAPGAVEHRPAEAPGLDARIDQWERDLAALAETLSRAPKSEAAIADETSRWESQMQLLRRIRPGDENSPERRADRAAKLVEHEERKPAPFDPRARRNHLVSIRPLAAELRQIRNEMQAPLASLVHADRHGEKAPGNTVQLGQIMSLADQVERLQRQHFLLADHELKTLVPSRFAERYSAIEAVWKGFQTMPLQDLRGPSARPVRDAAGAVQQEYQQMRKLISLATWGQLEEAYQ